MHPRNLRIVLSYLENIAVEEEQAYVTLRSNVLLEVAKWIESSHPLIFAIYDLCELVANDKLSKLSISVQKRMCDVFEIYISTFKQTGRCILLELSSKPFKTVSLVDSFKLAGLPYTGKFVSKKCKFCSHKS